MMLKVVETVPLCRVGMDVFWNLTLQLTCAMNIYQGTFTSGIVSHTHYNYTCNAVSVVKWPFTMVKVPHVNAHIF